MEINWPLSSEPAEVAGDEVHVWAAALDRKRVLPARQWEVLASDERERAERFRVEDARRRFVAARAALRNLLGQYLRVPPGDVMFVYDASGKPRLKTAAATADLRFNLAHSGELALVAVTRGCEVGVDVERLRAVNHWQQIAERFYHPHEVTQIAALPPDQRCAAFLRCWTGKEAVLKAIGIGLTRSLDFFVGSAVPHDGTWIDLPAAAANDRARCWLQPLSPASDYLGAVACLDAQRRLRLLAMA